MLIRQQVSCHMTGHFFSESEAIMKHHNVVLPMVLLVVLSAITACGIYIYLETKDIEEDVAVVENVKQQVVLEPLILPVDTILAESKPVQTDQNLLRRIDFTELQSINTDATRWVYIPDTNIDYYVMQEQTVGEYYYLWRDIHKKQSSWGSILTPKEPMNMEDAHLLLFGHHMRDKTVAFSSLNLYNDQSYGEGHPYVYLYYPDRSERWKLWAVCNSNSSDMIYEIPYTLGSDAYQSLIHNIDSIKTYGLGEVPDNTTQTLVLSTCRGSQGGSPLRFYIVCVLDDVYYYE